MNTEYTLTAGKVWNMVENGEASLFSSEGWYGTFYGFCIKPGEVHMSFSCGEDNCCQFDYDTYDEWITSHLGDYFKVIS